MSSIRRRQSLFVLGVISFFTSPLNAQPVVSATSEHLARSLREEGVGAARSGDWSSAREHFQRSYDLDPRLLTLYNLAASEMNVGALVEADEHFRLFIHSTADGSHQEFNTEAAHFREQLTGRVAGLRVQLTNLLSSDSITLNGDVLPHAALGVDLRVNPGRHVIAIMRGNETLAEDTRVLGEGGHEEINMTLPVAGPEMPTPREVAETTQTPLVDPFDEPSPPSHRGRNIAIGLSVTAVVIALAVGGYFLFAETGTDPYVGDFNLNLGQ